MGFCKEEQLSDEEFVANISVVENTNRAWYPSECLLENWKEEDEVTSSSKESFIQGHSLHHMLLAKCLDIAALASSISVQNSF